MTNINSHGFSGTVFFRAQLKLYIFNFGFLNVCTGRTFFGFVYISRMSITQYSLSHSQDRITAEGEQLYQFLISLELEEILRFIQGADYY